MGQEPFPFGDHVRLTSDVIDFYVARARDERAKAIGQFGRDLASWVATITARLARRNRKARSRRLARSPTA